MSKKNSFYSVTYSHDLNKNDNKETLEFSLNKYFKNSVWFKMENKFHFCSFSINGMIGRKFKLNLSCFIKDTFFFTSLLVFIFYKSKMAFNSIGLIFKFSNSLFLVFKVEYESLSIFSQLGGCFGLQVNRRLTSSWLTC